MNVQNVHFLEALLNSLEFPESNITWPDISPKKPQIHLRINGRIFDIIWRMFIKHTKCIIVHSSDSSVPTVNIDRLPNSFWTHDGIEADAY